MSCDRAGVLIRARLQRWRTVNPAAARRSHHEGCPGKADHPSDYASQNPTRHIASCPTETVRRQTVTHMSGPRPVTPCPKASGDAHHQIIARRSNEWKARVEQQESSGGGDARTGADP